MVKLTEYDYLKSLKVLERIINKFCDELEDLEEDDDGLKEDTLCEMIFQLEELESILESGLDEVTRNAVQHEN